jgi:excinuclease ABC subunit C
VHGDQISYVIRRGRVRAVLPSPRSADERRAFDAKVAGIFAPVEHGDGTVPSHEIDELLLVTSWFTRFPKEMARTTALAPAVETRSA